VAFAKHTYVSYVCSRTSTWEDHNFEKILKHVWSRVGITDFPSHQTTAHDVPPGEKGPVNTLRRG